MQFTRFLAALSVFSLVAAAPTTPRALPSVSVPQVLGTLQTSVHGVLGKIDTLLKDGGATQEVLGPLVDDLVSALDTTSVDLGELVLAATTPSDSKLITDVLSSIITEVNTTVAALGTAVEPGVATALVGVHASLATVIGLVEALVPGVLAVVTGLVGTLTTTLGALLQGLGLGSLLNSLPLGL